MVGACYVKLQVNVGMDLMMIAIACWAYFGHSGSRIGAYMPSVKLHNFKALYDEKINEI